MKVLFSILWWLQLILSVPVFIIDNHLLIEIYIINVLIITIIKVIIKKSKKWKR